MKGLLIKDIRMMGQQRIILASIVGISILMGYTLEGSFLPGYLSVSLYASRGLQDLCP